MEGDILTRKNSGNFEITSSNVKGEIQKYIKKYIDDQKNRSDKVKMSDLIKIYYVTDTDDCFIKTEDYSDNKKKCLSKMFNFNKVSLSQKNDVDFEVIFFAKDLEEVIYGHSVETDEEKKRISNEFAEKTLKQREHFIDTFKNQAAVKIWNSYRESYEGIKTYTGKACNMNVLIDEIEKGFEIL